MLKDASLLILITIVTVCIIVGSVSSIVWKNDNPIEEVAEDIIKEETGLDIDLSPSSPEKL